jgi:two-component system cell cycle sensor histidine kinase/response regulator CckA
MMTKLFDRINALIGDPGDSSSANSTGLQIIWRERLLRLLLLTGSTLGLVFAIPILFILLKEGKIALVIVDLSAILCMFTLLLMRKLSYNFRATFASLLLYFLGIGVIANMGPFSGGPAFLFCFAVIAGVLLGMRVAVAALVLNTLTMLAAAWLMFNGWWPNVDRMVLTTGRWLAAGFSFVFLNSVATISVTFLVRGLETALQSETEAKAELQERQKELELEIKTRVEYQTMLAENQERFRVLSDEVSFDGLLIHDQGTIVDVNQSFAQMHGYEKEELIGMNNLQVLDPGSRDVVSDRCDRGVEGNIEVAAIRKDGTTFPIEIRSRNISMGGKRVRAVAVRDITVRKQAEQELKDREEWYRTTLEHTGTAMAVSDQNATIVMVNDKFCEMVGIPRQEILGKFQWHEFVEEQDLPRMKEYAEARMTGGDAPEEYEFVFKDCHGKRRQVLHNIKIIPGSGLSISSIIDITDRKQAEAALRESEEKFRQIIQASPMGIYVYELRDDGSLVLTTANPAADRILKINHSNLIGKSIEEAFPPLADTEIPRRFREAAAKDKAWFTEFVDYQDERVNGTYEVYAFQTAPGKVTVMYMDVTDRKLAEEAKAKLEAQLRQAQKMEAIGTLAGGIAHDFNNILSAIMGYGELAQLETSKGRHNSAQLEQIVAAAERARDLVKQILTFSRRSETDLKSVDLNQLMSHSVDLLGRTIPKMIEIKMNLAGKLAKVRADATMLEQVIMNLAGNASDAMPEGGVLRFETSVVTLDQEFSQRYLEIAPGDYVLLSVSDTGLGMEKEILDHIFDPFFTTKDIGKGTGLGLSTAYGIVKEHGGHIICESEPGQGTSFKIYLPAQAEGQSDIQPMDIPLTSEPGGSETLLLVDDEETIRELGGQLLEGMGYKVINAASGEEALERYKSADGNLDMVILDLGMPGMGGHRCLKELLALDPNLKVLIASGYSADGNIKDLLDEGAAGYIPKPFKRADLLRTVRAVLDK